MFGVVDIDRKEESNSVLAFKNEHISKQHL